jgi:hypothetical protein
LPIVPVLRAIALLTEAARRGRPLPLGKLPELLEIPASGVEEVLELVAAEVGGELGLGLTGYAVDARGRVHPGWGYGEADAPTPQQARQHARSMLIAVEQVQALSTQAPPPAGAPTTPAGNVITARTQVIRGDSGTRSLHIQATDPHSDVQIEVTCPATDEAGDAALGAFDALPAMLRDALALSRRKPT